MPQSDGSGNGGWNPRGTGAWRLIDCTVQQAVYRDGSSNRFDSILDPIVHAPLNGADARVEGKIVDLDPQQQMVSEIWGFQVGVRESVSQIGFRGEFEVAAFADIWKRNPQAKSDAAAGAFYQSVLHISDWQTGKSRLLKEFCDGDTPPQQLSIKFNVDQYDMDPASPTFTLGRVNGSIGRYLPGEPVHFVAGRVLSPTAESPLFHAYAQLRDRKLWLDLGNSLPGQSPLNPTSDPPGGLGTLYAAILPSGEDPILLGIIPYDRPDWLQRAGLISFPVADEHLGVAAECPLAIVRLTSDGPKTLLLERPEGFVRADQYVFRLNPPEPKTTRFYACRFGKPVAGQVISLGFDPHLLDRSTVGAPPVGEPQKALQFATSLTTGEDGTADLTLTPASPGTPREYIDGQVYTITYALGDAPPAQGAVRNASRALNVLVFDDYAAPEDPTWLRDVQPIFQRYDNLFPAMRSIVELSNFASVTSRLGILRKVFDNEESAPNYMPVSRDLSKAKRQMIRRWLDRPLYMRLDSVDELQRALQLAIEVEHSTIPPYLTALYSIKDGANSEVAKVLREIVVQEMAHMAHVANLLISIGFSPKIYDPAFVPRYPGPMPGGLRGGLTVRLRRCSIAQMRDVFMSMEEPEETVAAGHTEHELHPYTIGWFYDEIAIALTALHAGGKISFGNLDQQVTGWPGPNAPRRVSSLEEAMAALHIIKRQGESSLPFDPAQMDGDLGHYYRFAEIVVGKTMVVDPERQSFAYTGDPISFDPDAVWPVMDDPDLTCYPANSRAATLALRFAQTYQALLKGLHRTFNGDPAYLQEALGLMFSLNVQARELVRTPSGLNDGTTAGPVFQWVGP